MSVQDDNAGETRGHNSDSEAQGNEANASQTVVDCGSSLDISSVKDFSKTLIESLDSGQPVLLNAENVENADGAAMQLLYAFFHDAKASGVDLSWNAPTEALKRSASLLGMSNHLELN